MNLNEYEEISGRQYKQRISDVIRHSKCQKLCFLLLALTVAITGLFAFLSFYFIGKCDELLSNWGILLAVLTLFSLVVLIYIVLEIRTVCLADIILCDNRRLALENKDFTLSFYCRNPKQLERIKDKSKELTRKVFYRNIKTIIHDKAAMVYAVDCAEYDVTADNTYTRHNTQILIPDTFENNEFWQEIENKSKVKTSEQTIPLSLSNRYVKILLVLYTVILLIVFVMNAVSAVVYSRKYNENFQTAEQLAQLRTLDYYSDALADASYKELRAIDIINSNSELGMTFMSQVQDESVYAADGTVMGFADPYPDENSPLVLRSIVITPNEYVSFIGMHDGATIKDCKDIMTKYGFEYFNQDASINEGCTVFFIERVTVVANYNKSDNIVRSFKVIFS
ncbi:MAG: hypothetical protein MJ153_08165 [Clostridia bacterium]|nr:hypothetical protein [Clostridia bacterium]